MTAAEILDRLLDELGDLECPHGHITSEAAPTCPYCYVLAQVVEIYMKAEDERDRARLIFGEAA